MKAWQILTSDGDDWNEDFAEVVFADTEGKARYRSDSDVAFIDLKAKRLPAFDGLENDENGLILAMLRNEWWYTFFSENREATIQGGDMTESDFSELEKLLRRDVSDADAHAKRSKELVDLVIGINARLGISDGTR